MTHVYTIPAKIVRWIDGDTVDLMMDIGFSVFLKNRIRLRGVDTPERGQEGFKEATAFCNTLAPPGSEVTLISYGKDKYGRWVGDIIVDEISVGEELLEANLAKLYS